jgi:hypothetical protein
MLRECYDKGDNPEDDDLVSIFFLWKNKVLKISFIVLMVKLSP